LVANVSCRRTWMPGFKRSPMTMIAIYFFFLNCYKADIVQPLSHAL
jgi:hypothetical protein